MSGQGRLITTPPVNCQYAGGPCDQSFDGLDHRDAFFIYPSDPRLLAATIEEAIRRIGMTAPNLNVISWKGIGISGQIIFCRVCQNERFAAAVVPDVSTLNLNVLFEIGCALGLDRLVLPIRDTSMVRDRKLFDALGLLDTFGFVDFENSGDLATKIPFAISNARPVLLQQHPINKD
jgi:hypothetical protein